MSRKIWCKGCRPLSWALHLGNLRLPADMIVHVAEYVGACCREVINQLYAKIKEIRAEFKVKNDEYYERQRSFRAQQAEERAERWEPQ